jgi:hypothetical protein
MNGIIPTSGQVDKWTSGWGVHNNCLLVMGFASRVSLFVWASVLLHHQIQFSGESFFFHLICKRSFFQLVADSAVAKRLQKLQNCKRERDRERKEMFMDTNPTKNQNRKDTYL